MLNLLLRIYAGEIYTVGIIVELQYINDFPSLALFSRMSLASPHFLSLIFR